MEEKERRFPIQNDGTVPWSEAEKAYETYARFFGTDQSLERLAQRGGFGIAEFCWLYVGKNPIGQQEENTHRIILVVVRQLKDAWVPPQPRADWRRSDGLS